MRIRKRGNARTGESSGAQRPGGVGGSHQEQLVASSLQIAQDCDTVANDVEHDTMKNTGEEETRGGTGISADARIHERAGIGGSTSRPSPTLVVDLWQRDRGTLKPSESYMNLDEFVNSLEREKCFPAEELADHPRDSSVTPVVQIDDRHFERLAGGSSMASQSSSFEELDTSLRLGQASHPAMAAREERGKSKMEFLKEFESDSENDGRKNLAPEFHVKRRGNPRAGYDTSGDEALEGRNQKSSPSPSSIEECDESNTVRRPVSNLTDAELELEPSPSGLETMKSSTESMLPWFSKKRRVSEDTDSPNRRRLPSPAPTTTEEPLAADHPAKQPRRSPMFSLYTVYHEAGREGLTAGDAMSTIMQKELPGFEDPECRSRRHVTKLLRNSPYFMELGEGKFALCSAMIDEEKDDSSEEEAGSDSSHRPEASRLPVSSSSLAITDNEKRNEEVELERTANESGGTATAGASSQHTERKPSGRSGRPKRLKYLKQDNVEELGNQCNRSDGKGWTCPLLAKTGYQLCDHHLDKLRCKPGSRSKYNKKKKKKHT